MRNMIRWAKAAGKLESAVVFRFVRTLLLRRDLSFITSLLQTLLSWGLAVHREAQRRPDTG